MVRPAIGERVFVKTLLFEGWSTVGGYADCAFHPIEVILEEPDSDGHRYKRVGRDKIIEVEGGRKYVRGV